MHSRKAMCTVTCRSGVISDRLEWLDDVEVKSEMKNMERILGIWTLKIRAVARRQSPGILSGASRGFPLKKERVWVWYEIRILCVKMTQINTSGIRSYKTTEFFERRNEKTFTKSGLSKSQTFTKEEGFVSNIRHDHGWNDLYIQKSTDALVCKGKFDLQASSREMKCTERQKILAMSKGDRTENWASSCVGVTSSDPHL